MNISQVRKVTDRQVQTVTLTVEDIANIALQACLDDGNGYIGATEALMTFNETLPRIIGVSVGENEVKGDGSLAAFPQVSATRGAITIEFKIVKTS